MNRARWRVLPIAPPQHFQAFSSSPRTVAQLLYNRGITTCSQAESFLAADQRLSGDPFLLPDMEKALTRIYRALLSGEAIAIYGDFDADGVTSTALLAQGLATLGGTVIPYIPHRLNEGYGLNLPALEKLHHEGVTLVITADCGVTNLNEVEKAQGLNLDIIITDHHSIPHRIPPAFAVIDPKRPDCHYPFPHLTASGVVFKVLQGLHQFMRREMEEAPLDLVALGTVADVAPLIGENRYLVKEGLQALNRTHRPGLREMIELSGLKSGAVDTEAIAWVLGPRINAAGRLGSAMTSYRLLTTSSREEARHLAEELESRNTERQRLTEEVLGKAREQVLCQKLESLIMVGGEDYPAGVVGLVASKLAEEFYRPAIVMELGPEVVRGSARSIPEFNVIEALSQCGDLFMRFGGHTHAAGFTMERGKLDTLRQRLTLIAQQKLAGFDLTPVLNIDIKLPLSALNKSTLCLLERFAPFGQGNPQPLFLTSGVTVTEVRQVGNSGKHLRMQLKDGKVTWHAIGFRMGEHLGQLPEKIDVVYTLAVDRWGEEETLELNIVDAAPAGERLT